VGSQKHRSRRRASGRFQATETARAFTAPWNRRVFLRPPLGFCWRWFTQRNSH